MTGNPEIVAVLPYMKPLDQGLRDHVEEVLAYIIEPTFERLDISTETQIIFDNESGSSEAFLSADQIVVQLLLSTAPSALFNAGKRVATGNPTILLLTKGTEFPDGAEAVSRVQYERGSVRNHRKAIDDLFKAINRAIEHIPEIPTRPIDFDLMKQIVPAAVESLRHNRPNSLEGDDLELYDRLLSEIASLRDQLAELTEAQEARSDQIEALEAAIRDKASDAKPLVRHAWERFVLASAESLGKAVGPSATSGAIALALYSASTVLGIPLSAVLK